MKLIVTESSVSTLQSLGSLLNVAVHAAAPVDGAARGLLSDVFGDYSFDFLFFMIPVFQRQALVLAVRLGAHSVPDLIAICVRFARYWDTLQDIDVNMEENLDLFDWLLQ
jgi:hypothetical protein